MLSRIIAIYIPTQLEGLWRNQFYKVYFISAINCLALSSPSWRLFFKTGVKSRFLYQIIDIDLALIVSILLIKHYHTMYILSLENYSPFTFCRVGNHHQVSGASASWSSLEPVVTKTKWPPIGEISVDFTLI